MGDYIEQETVQELRVTFSTDSGKTVQLTVPDADLNEITTDTAISVYNAAKVKLTDDSTTTLVQATDGGNITGIKKAEVVNATYTTILQDYE